MPTFVERVQALGDRLGPIRITVQSPRDDGMLEFVLGSLPSELLVAWDFRDPSWDDIDGIVRVDDFESEPFRYIRLREPPYTDDDLSAVAGRTTFSADHSMRLPRKSDLSLKESAPYPFEGALLSGSVSTLDSSREKQHCGA